MSYHVQNGDEAWRWKILWDLRPAQMSLERNNLLTGRIFAFITLVGILVVSVVRVAWICVFENG